MRKPSRGPDGAGVQVGLCDGPLDLDLLGFDPACVHFFDNRGNARPSLPPVHGLTHGTAIARRMAGADGIAPAAQLHYAQALEHGWVLLRVLRAIDWLLSRPLEVLLLPLGVHPGTPVFDPLLARAEAQGVLVVAPVGNHGPGTATSPGDRPTVLCVGAAEDDGRCAGFSGSRIGADGLRDPDLLAPAEAAPCCRGTSSAAAWVAGWAALLIQACPGRSPAQLRRALIETAAPLPAHEQHLARRGLAVPDQALAYLLGSAGAAPVMPPAAPPVRRHVDPRYRRLLEWGAPSSPTLLRAACSGADDAWASLQALVAAHGLATDRIVAADSTGTGLICARPDELKRLVDDPRLELLQMAEVDSGSQPAWADVEGAGRMTPKPSPGVVGPQGRSGCAPGAR